MFGVQCPSSWHTWLEIWELDKEETERQGQPVLGDVTVGYGDSDTRSPLLVVTTVPIRSGRRRSQYPSAVDAALDDAMTRAEVGFFHTDSQISRDVIDHALPRAGRADTGLRVTSLQVETSISASEEATEGVFSIATQGHSWVAAANIGPVCIGAYGHGTRLEEHPLRRLEALPDPLPV